MFWILGDLQTLFIATPVGSVAFLVFVVFGDQLFLLPRQYLLKAIHGPTQPSNDELPSGLLIIPSLLRGSDELEAIKTTISNVVRNDYPGKMLVVASIDGTEDAPKLYAELRAWVAAQQASLPEKVCLLAQGLHDELPKIYFSTDADADLGPHALEYLARRLTKKGFLTGRPGRAVAGNLRVRDEQYWRGWRHLLTVEGQLTLQIARQYMASNMIRFNIRALPICGIPGALYCTWTDILVAGPKYMAFMKTFNRVDWAKWWLGFGPPTFSESDVAPIPELLAGDTDDTVSAFLAIMARWQDGRITFDAPRTPLHALYYSLRTVLFDRGLRYEPAARVYTSSPSTIGSLWKQRMRWNAARIEVAGRFSNSFRYHWDISLACMGSVGLMMKCLVFGAFAYIQAPLVMAKGGFLLTVGIGLAVQLAIYTASTVLALLIDGSFLSMWRLLLAVPLATIYMPVYGFWAGAAGMTKDLLLLGNCTKFAPESTLIKGGSSRVAIFARVRRALVLLVRSAVYGDVPFGTFWFGWGETKWTPSGYLGWTTGKRPSLYQRLRFGAEPAMAAPVSIRRPLRVIPGGALARTRLLVPAASRKAA